MPFPFVVTGHTIQKREIPRYKRLWTNNIRLTAATFTLFWISGVAAAAARYQVPVDTGVYFLFALHAAAMFWLVLSVSPSGFVTRIALLKKVKDSGEVNFHHVVSMRSGASVYAGMLLFLVTFFAALVLVVV